MTRRKRIVSLIPQALFDEFYTPEVEQAFAEYFEVDSRPGLESERELVDALLGAEGCLLSWRSPKLTSRVLEAATDLRIIGHAAGSVKEFVDPVAWDRGIVVVNAAHVIAKYVGEMALLLSLSLLRNISQNDQAMKSGVRWKPHAWTHTDSLHGKVVGLVGFGLTAREFMKLLAPFDVRILVYDPHVPADVIAEAGARKVTLEELAEASDIISLHAPKTDETEGMIGKETLSMMKDGALLINTARGSLIDEDALVAELRTGRIRAALDVYREEPLALDHPLRQLPGVILTPHLSGPVMTQRWRMLLSLADDFRQCLIDGERPARAIRKEQLALMT